MTDEGFVEFCTQVVLATERYASQPEMLKEEHEAIFRQYGVSPEEVREIMEEKFGEAPEKWIE